jgi:hypothetical protein
MANGTHSQKQLFFIHSATSSGGSELVDICFGVTNAQQMTAACQPTEEVTQPLHHPSFFFILLRAPKSEKTSKLTSICKIFINE